MGSWVSCRDGATQLLGSIIDLYNVQSSVVLKSNKSNLAQMAEETAAQNSKICCYILGHELLHDKVSLCKEVNLPDWRRLSLSLSQAIKDQVGLESGCGALLRVGKPDSFPAFVRYPICPLASLTLEPSPRVVT